MSFFGIKGPNAIKPVAPKIRSEKVQTKAPPKPLPHIASRASPSDRPSGQSRVRLTNGSSTPRSGASDSSRLRPEQSTRQRKRSPAQRIDFDSDDDDDDDNRSTASFEVSARKRQKEDNVRPEDLKRKLYSSRAFTEADGENLVHAADIACVKLGFKPQLGATEDNVSIRLQYPGATKQEQHQLVFLKDQLNSVEEICKVINNVRDFYLTREQAECFEGESGIIRRLERAKNTRSIEDFKSALNIYNEEISKLRKDGYLARNIDDKHNPPFDLVTLILNQVYERIVSPKVDSLKKYQNGTDNVYGELLPLFVTRVFLETRMKAEHVFVDMGSGVGNVVFQAALEVGCESWGCEMMKNAYTLADEQKKEFRARCRLWGLAPGKVNLEHGDFMQNTRIHDALRRADVVLINNQAFQPQLNDSLLHLFLDLKDGCKVVSLKPFGSTDNKISSYNENSLSKILVDVQKKEYFDKNVSWTDSAGTYFIATKDQRGLGDD